MQNEGILSQALQIFHDGGPLMLPLAVLAFIIYFSVIGLYLELFVRRFDRLDENLWRHWIDRPDAGSGELGDIIRFASENSISIPRLRACFSEVRADAAPVRSSSGRGRAPLGVAAQRNRLWFNG